MPYNPKSRQNLVKPRFGRVAGAASEAGKKSQRIQHDNRAQNAIVDKYISDLLDMVFGNSTLKEFQEMASKAPNQALRVAALNLSNPRKSLDTLAWLIERVKGKPKQVTENVNDTTIKVDKPTLVFGEPTRKK